MLKRLIAEKDLKKISLRSRAGILLSGSLNAGLSVLVLIVAARTVSIDHVGIITIAFSIAKLMLNIGKYGMRNYQVTEKADVHFSEWYISRIITTAAMILVSAAYICIQVLFHGYSFYKSTIVFLLCLLYATESVEDIFTGYYQKAGRLDVSSYIQSVRLTAILAVFVVCLVFFRDILAAVITADLLSAFLVCYYAGKTIGYFSERKEPVRRYVLKRILKDCFPLFLISFLLIYISNAARYEIDIVFSSEVQAYFGFVSTPIFAVSLLGGFIFQPRLALVSTMWSENKKRDFNRNVIRQTVYIAVMSGLCLSAGWFLGIPVLSGVYGVSGLASYKNVFMVLLLGGAGQAFINFMSAVLVILRRQTLILICHVIVGIGLFCTIGFAANHYGVMGASVNTSLWIWILAMLLAASYMLSCSRFGRKKPSDSGFGDALPSVNKQGDLSDRP